jgi:dihydroorotate dehydrogenase electron transfer subunit
LSNQKIGPDYYLLKLEMPETTPPVIPGQFFHLKINRHQECYDPLLRRPLSIYDLNGKDISFVYRVIGKGTGILKDYRDGEGLDMLGPLGNGFRINFHSSRLLIIGGGMGIVPLYLLARRLAVNNQLKVLIGTNTVDELHYFSNIFQMLDISLSTATLDGSSGYKGTVTDLWQNDLSFKPDFLFTCGPVPMLKKIQIIASDLSIKGQVSLEKRMGCGIGVCLSCIQPTKSGNQRVCKEGPVFNLDEVIFDE